MTEVHDEQRFRNNSEVACDTARFLRHDIFVMASHIRTVTRGNRALRDVRGRYGPSAAFSTVNRPPPKYEGHVPLTFIERTSMAIGSAFGSLLNPRRGGTYSSDGDIDMFRETDSQT